MCKILRLYRVFRFPRFYIWSIKFKKTFNTREYLSACHESVEADQWKFTLLAFPGGLDFGIFICRACHDRNKCWDFVPSRSLSWSDFFFSQANLFVLNFPPHFMVLHIYSQDIAVICEFLQRGDDKSLKNSKIATKKVARNAQEELTE